MGVRPAEPFELPDQRQPCSRLQPFDKDERIWWAFSCAAERSLQQTGTDAARRLVYQMQAWDVADGILFGKGFTDGFFAGAREALKRYLDDLQSLLRGLVMGYKELLGATYDPQNFVNATRFYAARPGSEAQAQALQEAGEYFESEYPGLADALRAVAMVTAAMQAISQWIETTPDAAFQVAMTVSKALGKVLGDEAAKLVALAGSPNKLGEELGDLCGNATVEIAQLVLGF